MFPWMEKGGGWSRRGLGHTHSDCITHAAVSLRGPLFGVLAVGEKEWRGALLVSGFLFSLGTGVHRACPPYLLTCPFCKKGME